MTLTTDSCWFCGVTLVPEVNHPQMRTRDHLTPRSRGGTEYHTNLVLACLRCNGDKASLTLEEYRAVVSLRFGVAAKFWGEGQQPITLPVEPKKAEARALKYALIRETRQGPLHPISVDEMRHLRKLQTLPHPANNTLIVQPFWVDCPRLDKRKSSESDLVGRKFGSLLVVGVAMEIKSKAKFICLCECGRYTARTSQSIRNVATNSWDKCHGCAEVKSA